MKQKKYLPLHLSKFQMVYYTYKLREILYSPTENDARMAESVDATVSNTVGAIHPGSIPGPGTNKS